MSVLSAQAIREHCSSDTPLISPFYERGLANGLSYGLSGATYDCRIDQDLTLEPMPFEALVENFNKMHELLRMMAIGEHSLALEHLEKIPKLAPPGKWAALASTMEKFILPNDICATPLDKSSRARVFVSAFNTHFDPGFRGYATIELVNLGYEPAVFKKGDPVCQFKFELLDRPTDLPYNGKYQNQEQKPVSVRLEGN